LLAALFGWIMVASGLINRPWVNAYKLTIHLLLGISLFVSLFYTWMAEGEIQNFSISQQWYRTIKVLILFTLIQICFGGFVSGMKSALLYPTWPLMNGAWVPEIIFSRSHWNVDNLLLYDQSGFMPALVQVIHRLMAYLLFVFCLVFAFKWKKNQPKEIHWIGYSLVGIIVVQITLGVLTLLGSRGSIPVLYGALHQGVGILLLTAMIYTWIKAKVIET
jgi:cytochrome c oxidase assembly protein subunit 15